MHKQVYIFPVLIGLLFLAGCRGTIPTPAAPTIREFPLPTPSSGAQWMTAGPDGTLWFLGLDRALIGRLTPAGQITEFPLPSANQGEYEEMTAGLDRNLWFTEFGADQIGRITPARQVTEFPLPAPQSDPSRPRWIVAGPDGNLWFTKDTKVGRITPGGQITQFALPAGDNAVSLTAGPDGRLWVSLGNQLGRLSPDGQITVFALPRGSYALQMTAGPAGTLWFTEYDNNQLGRFTPTR